MKRGWKSSLHSRDALVFLETVYDMAIDDSYQTLEAHIITLKRDHDMQFICTKPTYFYCGRNSIYFAVNGHLFDNLSCETTKQV